MRKFTLILASLALLLCAASEIVLTIPVAGWLYVIVTALFAAGLLRRQWPWQQPARLITLFATCLIIAALNRLPWSSRSGFLKRLDAIRPGMTVSEVRKVMAGYREGTGWPANPFAESRDSRAEFEIEGAIVFRHSDEPAYNADWGVVHFQDGRVTKVEFSPD
jgi:hypothetical protein